MHIPDGFISPLVAGTTGALSAGAIALSLNKSKMAYGIRLAPILGLTTAFIFAAQMINFPVTGGTSGHLLGGTLAAIILGSPWSATLCISTVLIIQAVLFADGGITALGANILNMGLVGVWVGWGLTQTLQRLLGGSRGRLPLAGGIAAGISVVVAAIFASLELAISNTAPINVVLPAMSSIHVLIGVGEGLVTGGVLSYLAKTRPDLLPGEQRQFRGFLVPVVSILLVAGVLSLFASTFPDGLDWVAQTQGFEKLAENVRVVTPTPFADYEISGLSKIGTSIAGVVGSGVCFGIAFVLAQIVKPRGEWAENGE
ncbi:energy-coupling factor ABC transporter permease [Calothrix sp. PCC 6303]|uniref:energy-coupling factor ABC transporter permease n=1 Tax=Calothrix sp. PCC 6303 TaxID=1170562 RepID=UPI0002A04C00|nr:energy-coupling factor ABC transporter permease [Calothrix sp. PCC 6303]AFZ02213.1 cobalamin (vitamin B12) biosynthesis CbiM protein [Calothrix sp. PCC 6303]